MIRNAVLHINNEQPMIADLFEAPNPGDVGLRCTNLRTLDGKRPVFIDDSAAIFFFPYLHIRFVEIPAGALNGSDSGLAVEVSNGAKSKRSQPAPEPEADLEIDDDFLRRVREA